MANVTMDDVFNAVKDEVQLWRNLQIGAIRSFNSSNLPYLENKPAIFQAAVWFGLGMDAVGKFTPGNAVAKLVTRAAIPITILDLTTKYFARQYAKIAQEQRIILSTKAEVFKEKLINGISDAERNFYTDQAFGIPLQKKLLDLSKPDSFSTPQNFNSLIRRTLKDSGAIVTDSITIGSQTQKALEKVSKVVENIYLVSNYGTDVHKELKVSNSTGPFSNSDFVASNCRLTRDLLARMKPGEKVGYLDYSARNPLGLVGHPAGDKFKYIADEKTLNHFLANAWRYESRHGAGGGFGECHVTWLWRATRPIDPSYLASTYNGSMSAVEKTYKKLRNQYAV